MDPELYSLYYESSQVEEEDDDFEQSSRIQKSTLDLLYEYTKIYSDVCAFAESEK